MKNLLDEEFVEPQKVEYPTAILVFLCFFALLALIQIVGVAYYFLAEGREITDKNFNAAGFLLLVVFGLTLLFKHHMRKYRDYGEDQKAYDGREATKAKKEEKK